MGIAEGMAKMFGPKIDKKKKEKKAEEAGLPEHIMDMAEGSDKDRAIAVHKANAKRDKEGDKYECGGVKYSKLKDRMKKGKKD